jgi:hypothetical protein
MKHVLKLEILNIPSFRKVFNVRKRFPENLALKKNTTMSSKYQIMKDTSSKAVDGNTGQRMPECIMTASGQHQAWWQVDLGVEQSVSNIRITYQKSMCTCTFIYFMAVIRE